MNRKIKFRVWHKPRGEMYSGQLAVARWHYSFVSEYLVWMQYTGFTDESGKEVYEGDIVRWSGPVDEGELVGVVVIEKGHVKVRDGNVNPYLYEEYLDCIKVLGNKFEDPEILEGV